MGDTDIRTVQHEYGHKVQLKTMNFADYMLNVSLPSITINLLYRLDKLPYDYYDAPWEKQADEFGGVTNRKIGTPWPKSGPNTFFELIPLFFK